MKTTLFCCSVLAIGLLAPWANAQVESPKWKAWRLRCAKSFAKLGDSSPDIQCRKALDEAPLAKDYRKLATVAATLADLRDRTSRTWKSAPDRKEFLEAIAKVRSGLGEAAADHIRYELAAKIIVETADEKAAQELLPDTASAETKDKALGAAVDRLKASKDTSHLSSLREAERKCVEKAKAVHVDRRERHSPLFDVLEEAIKEFLKTKKKEDIDDPDFLTEVRRLLDRPLTDSEQVLALLLKRSGLKPLDVTLILLWREVPAA